MKYTKGFIGGPRIDTRAGSASGSSPSGEGEGESAGANADDAPSTDEIIQDDEIVTTQSWISTWIRENKVLFFAIIAAIVLFSCMSSMMMILVIA